MKKLLFLFVVLAFMSCKDQEYCWKCNREMRAEDEYYSRVTEECGMTEDEARAYEVDGSYHSDKFVVSTSCIKE